MAYKKKSNRKKYSSDERMLYVLGQYDSKNSYEKSTRMGRLLKKVEAKHPSYIAGVTDGAKKRVKFMRSKGDIGYGLKDDGIYQRIVNEKFF